MKIYIAILSAVVCLFLWVFLFPVPDSAVDDLEFSYQQAAVHLARLIDTESDLYKLAEKERGEAERRMLIHAKTAAGYRYTLCKEYRLMWAAIRVDGDSTFMYEFDDSTCERFSKVSL